MSRLSRTCWENYKIQRDERLKREHESRKLTTEDVGRYFDRADARNALFVRIANALEKNDKKSVKIGKLEIRV